MQELLYLEVPTPDLDAVCRWLRDSFVPTVGTKTIAATGFRWTPKADGAAGEVVACVWSLQRTTYLKVFRWADRAIAGETTLVRQLETELRQAFPPTYPAPPEIDLAHQSIFEALGDRYPQTVKFFQKMPNGEADLNRAYWWERRWRSLVKNPQPPQPVLGQGRDRLAQPPTYDLIYVGGALGVVHAAVMARRGYRVLLLERMPFGRMNREWNISRQEFQSLIDLGLFTAAEFEQVIGCEYRDGFHKFFDANNPPQARAAVLHTPTVLNIAVKADRFIQMCGEKLRAAGGEIRDRIEFQRATVLADGVQLEATDLRTDEPCQFTGRLLVDAMGTASPIAWQLNGGRAFDSVCPTVGAVIHDGFPEGVWDHQYGDVLFSHGDISRGRQLIWELFPIEGGAVTVYLFHYHQIHPENPGSLLEMYEDFFSILPEYRRCDMDALEWGKATFGYIPGHFSGGEGDRKVAYDRLIALGDAAALQSPLVFTGFGSLVRNLDRLTVLLDTALRHDLLDARSLESVRAYQSNIAVTWLFSKGMMVPTGRILPPVRVNAMLNTFFGVMADGSPEVADRFIKDRVGWGTFMAMALRAAWQNPAMLLWILDSAGVRDMVRWLPSFVSFTIASFLGWLLGWLPRFARSVQPWLEPRSPGLWLWLLGRVYAVTAGLGRPEARSPNTPPPTAPPAPMATAGPFNKTGMTPRP
ncbi:MAG: flavin-dependent dehydrogenase [Cyanobacteria bacterium]|nr:flavin-dependent dehydrogenase [Cyanobacteriota bacterium]